MGEWENRKMEQLLCELLAQSREQTRLLRGLLAEGSEPPTYPETQSVATKVQP
jgi:hypothetical protein